MLQQQPQLAPTTTTAPPTTTTTAPTTTTSAPTTSTAPPTTTTAPPTTTTVAPTTTTTTASPTTTTVAPTTTTSAPTTTTAAPTTTTTAPTTTTAAPTTTTAFQPVPATNTTTTTTTESPAAVYYVGVVVFIPFNEDLKNETSQQFMDLAKRITAVYDMLYRKAFGARFIRSYVIAFRVSLASRIRMNVTEAEVGVEFNKTTPLVELPKNEVVQKTLADAIDTANNNTIMDVPFSPGSVEVIRSPLPTTLPTTNSTVTTMAPNSTTTTTAKPTTKTTTTTTTAKPTTKITPTVEAIITRKLTFRSRGETFTTDLLNPSSAAFKSRAALIKSYLEPLFQREFSTLRDFIVTSFSNGSIINNMNLKFSAAFAPSNIQIAEVLLKAALNVTTFNIDTGSILVDDTAVSSGVSHNISLITALSLVLLSWLLSNQQ
ncbi:uncharacterized protein PB18E9.04c-like [Poecilia latipinna]|uniref:uncharacterized protein PB18E9.04c-like n=1 Tax=Poecilia latipinna TaxID=48699 RepID=UPI00072DD972|nr:PREDICTED: uncharacterized protein PB18E9.04c-like [Poecilia latipinna]